jgi:hypothetical protein
MKLNIDVLCVDPEVGRIIHKTYGRLIDLKTVSLQINERQHFSRLCARKLQHRKIILGNCVKEN